MNFPSSNINLDEINIDSIDALDQLRNNLINLKHNYQNEIEKIKKMCKNINIEIAKRCHNNGGHEWTTEREDCMYGERYTFCKKCRCDYYDYSYWH